MTDQEKVLHTLEAGASQRVSFNFTSSTGVTVTVNPSTFRRVAGAIRSGTVSLVITNSFPAGVFAEYLGQADTPRGIGANTLRVRRLTGRMEEASLLHESVHASFDLTRSGGVNASNEEAAAYIAEYVYYRRTGLAPLRVVSDSITRAARPIADNVVRGRAITTAQITALANAISGHPTYSSIPAGPYTQDG